MATLQEYLMMQPMVARYADRYSRPLIKYAAHVPEKYLNGWLRQPDTTVYDLALYLIGVRGRRPADFVSWLVTLERNGLYTVPLRAGILSLAYWDKWARESIAARTDAEGYFIDGAPQAAPTL